MLLLIQPALDISLVTKLAQPRLSFFLGLTFLDLLSGFSAGNLFGIVEFASVYDLDDVPAVLGPKRGDSESVTFSNCGIKSPGFNQPSSPLLMAEA